MVESFEALQIFDLILTSNKMPHVHVKFSDHLNIQVKQKSSSVFFFSRKLTFMSAFFFYRQWVNGCYANPFWAFKEENNKSFIY